MTYFLPGVFIRVHFPFSSSAFGQFPVKSSQIGERGGPADEQTSASVQLGSGHRQNDVKGSLFCYLFDCLILVLFVVLSPIYYVRVQTTPTILMSG